jgi:hypothetical protein
MNLTLRAPDFRDVRNTISACDMRRRSTDRMNSLISTHTLCPQVWSRTCVHPSRCLHTLMIFEAEDDCGAVVAIRTAVVKSSSSSSSSQDARASFAVARVAPSLEESGDLHNKAAADQDAPSACAHGVHLEQAPEYVVIATERGPLAVLAAYTWHVIAHIRVRDDLTAADRLTSLVFYRSNLLLFCYAVCVCTALRIHISRSICLGVQSYLFCVCMCVHLCVCVLISLSLSLPPPSL